MIYQILSLLIWGSSFIAAKYSYEMLDAALMVEARLLIAALMVLPSCYRHFGKIPRREWKPLLWIAFINYVVVLLLQFIGLKYTSAASAITMVGLEPLLVVFVGHFFFNDKAKIYHWICGAAAFVGIGMMVLGGAEEGGAADAKTGLAASSRAIIYFIENFLIFLKRHQNKILAYLLRSSKNPIYTFSDNPLRILSPVRQPSCDKRRGDDDEHARS